MESKNQFGYNKSRRGKNARNSGTYNKKGPRNPRASQGTITYRSTAGAVSNNTGNVLRYMPLFPERTERNLTYAPSGLSVITGTATANAYVFSANGVYDPDITGTGGQPMGFDQMIAFYNHYTVLSARIRCVVINTSTTLPCSAGIMVSGDSTVLSSIEQLLENGYFAYCTLGFPYGVQGSMANLKIACDNARFQGVDSIMSDPNMRGDAASNPTEQTYFHICVWNPASATQVTCLIQPIIEYQVVFHEPRKAALS